MLDHSLQPLITLLKSFILLLSLHQFLSNITYILLPIFDFLFHVSYKQVLIQIVHVLVGGLRDIAFVEKV